jgi:uncharacterized protein YkwD
MVNQWHSWQPRKHNTVLLLASLHAPCMMIFTSQLPPCCCFCVHSFYLAASNNNNGGGSNNGGNNGSGVDAQLLALVNAARRQNGRRELSLDSRLNAAASAHSIDQARRRTMSHTGGDCSSFDQRITRAGYRWSRAAENVAMGQTSAQSVFNAWMNSSGHRANILGDLVHMGAAFATGSDGRMYWTQVFGTPM